MLPSPPLFFLSFLPFRKELACNIAPRVLISAVSDCYSSIVDKHKVCNVLTQVFAVYLYVMIQIGPISTGDGSSVEKDHPSGINT